MAAETQTPINFGFLLIPLQLLDMAGPMDVLSNSSKSYVEAYAKFYLATAAAKQNPPTAEAMISSSLDINFHHIGPTMDPVATTGGFYAKPTCTVDDCPRLDYLLVGGPHPEYFIEPGKMPGSMKRFIRDSSKECKTVFATCTGAAVLAATGVLDGQLATVNHAFVPVAQTIFPTVKWSSDKNWVVSEDGKFWTSAGACAGMDMMTEWVSKQTSVHITGLCTMTLEYQPRDVDGKFLSYVNGKGEFIKA